jgi:hypothetical protein
LTGNGENADVAQLDSRPVVPSRRLGTENGVTSKWLGAPAFAMSLDACSGSRTYQAQYQKRPLVDDLCILACLRKDFLKQARQSVRLQNRKRNPPLITRPSRGAQASTVHRPSGPRLGRSSEFQRV